MSTFYFFFSIRGDSTPREKMPRDGTVFQLTSNVILFLQQIHEFVDTLAMILTQDTSYNQTLLRLPRKISVSERNPALVGLYIKKVLVQLNLTLVTKSDHYSDQFLKAVFRYVFEVSYDVLFTCVFTVFFVYGKFYDFLFMFGLK